MSDLIRRQDVLDYIDTMPSELTSDGRRMVRRIMLTEYIADTLPSAEAEIIHCKDCKYYRRLTGNNNYCDHDFAGIRHVPFDDDYCSYAERREEW